MSATVVDEAGDAAEADEAPALVAVVIVEAAVDMSLTELDPDEAPEVEVAPAVDALDVPLVIVALAADVPVVIATVAAEEPDASLLDLVLSKVAALPVGLAVEAATVAVGAPRLTCDVL